MKPSKLFWHMHTNHTGLKNKPLEFFLKGKTGAHRKKAVIGGHITLNNANVLKASYLVTHRIAKANKAFTIG